MKRDCQGPGPEGFKLCSSVSEKVSKIDRWMNMARKKEIETDKDQTIDFRFERQSTSPLE